MHPDARRSGVRRCACVLHSNTSTATTRRASCHVKELGHVSERYCTSRSRRAAAQWRLQLRRARTRRRRGRDIRPRRRRIATSSPTPPQPPRITAARRKSARRRTPGRPNERTYERSALQRAFVEGYRQREADEVDQVKQRAACFGLCVSSATGVVGFPLQSGGVSSQYISLVYHSCITHVSSCIVR